jgi:hypothetical protein
MQVATCVSWLVFSLAGSAEQSARKQERQLDNWQCTTAGRTLQCPRDLASVSEAKHNEGLAVSHKAHSAGHQLVIVACRWTPDLAILCLTLGHCPGIAKRKELSSDVSSEHTRACGLRASHPTTTHRLPFGHQAHPPKLYLGKCATTSSGGGAFALPRPVQTVQTHPRK